MKIIPREQLGVVYSIIFVPQHRSAEREGSASGAAKPEEKIDTGILFAILHFPQHILQWV